MKNQTVKKIVSLLEDLSEKKASTVIDFIIIAFAIFLVVRQMNRLKKKEEEKPAPPPKPSKEETLLTEIRDLLKAK